MTEKRVGQLRAPDPSGKQQLHWDADIKGFGVLCSGVSATKTYVVQRAIKGRTRRFTVGPVNVMTLAAARDQAKLIISDIYRGVDPKTKHRGSVTLRGALDEYIRVRHLRPRSADGYKDVCERHLKNWLDRPLRDITRDEVSDQLKKIAATVAKGGQHKGHATANGAMRVFRALYNFAADRAPQATPLPSNPVKLKKEWFPVWPRKGVIKVSGFPIFYEATINLSNTVGRDYILLVLFTGMRRREADRLRWDSVDFDSRVIHLSHEVTKAVRGLNLPMSDFVYDLLSARREIGDAGYVFPAASESGHIEEPGHFLGLVKDECGIKVSVHDLRRTFITVAESSDISYLALKALVNHALPKDVTSDYVQMMVERLREPVQTVSDKIKALCGIN